MVTKLKAILVSILAELKDIWNRSKMYLLGLAAILAAIEFRKIKDALLVYSGKKEIQADQKKDQTLANQENQANAQADALVKQAADLPNQEPQVKPDWYKDSK